MLKSMTLPSGHGSAAKDWSKWYSNGAVATISQAEWRRRDLLGEPPFFLINVTTESRAELTKALETGFMVE